MIPTPKVQKVEPRCERHGPMTSAMRLSGDGPVVCTLCVRLSGRLANVRRPLDHDDRVREGWRE